MTASPRLGPLLSGCHLGRVGQASAITVLLFLADLAPMSRPPATGARLVAVGGDACIELPADYAAGSMSSLIDAVGGRFESKSGGPTIEWYSGPVQIPFGIHWTQALRLATFHGWRLWWQGRIEIGDEAAYVAVHGDLVFLARMDSKGVPALLDSLAASYRTVHDASTCEVPRLVRLKRVNR